MSRACGELERALRDAGQAALAAIRQLAGAPAALVAQTRSRLGQGQAISMQAEQLIPELERYARQYQHLVTLRAELETTLNAELERARRYLREDSTTLLRPFIPFAASVAVQERIAGADAELAKDGRGANARHDRLYLSYLQRVCAKNDTISAFGPTGWGRFEPGATALRIQPTPGIARRHAFLEKWVVQELAAAMSEDPDVKPEIQPRLHPSGRVEGDTYLFVETGQERALNPAERAALADIDGKTPAYALTCAPGVLEQLASDRVIVWELEAFTLVTNRMELLLNEVGRWRDGTARARWLPRLTAVGKIAHDFETEPQPSVRQELMDAVTTALRELGREAKVRKRALYGAANPIGEECFRETGVVIGDTLPNRLFADAEPWIDLFCEVVGFVRDRVHDELRKLFDSAPRRSGRVALPAFLAHARASGFDLERDGLATLGAPAFAQVRDAFEIVFGPRSAAPEIEVTAEDCERIRQHFAATPTGRRISPSVDLQISAPDVAAVLRDEYELVIGELNTLCPIAAHLFFWACPDRAALAAQLRGMIDQPRVCHTTLRNVDRASHITYHWPEILGESWTCAAPERVPASWRQVAPADAEIVLDGELRVLAAATGEDLGALLNDWDISFSFSVHPFLYRSGTHVPRLRSGRTVLQRRCWVVVVRELAGGPYTGSTPLLIGAVEQLRRARDLPRHVFMRPTATALAQSSAEGRDKDVKPFYVDLESYLFIKIFHQRLVKYGELELTEMLPSPDQLLFSEEDGRRTFEFRALLPRS